MQYLPKIALLAGVVLAISSSSANAQQTGGNCNGSVNFSIWGESRCVVEVSREDSSEVRALEAQIAVLAQGNNAFRKHIEDIVGGLPKAPTLEDIRKEVLPLITAEVQRQVARIVRDQGPRPVPVLSEVTRDPIPHLTGLVPTRAAMSSAEAISSSSCAAKLKDVPRSTLEKFPELTKLVVFTESMDCDEKAYWMLILPAMTDRQTDRLFEILDTERRKLEELDRKYQTEIGCLNKKHVLEWTEFQRKSSKGEAENVAADREVAKAELDLMEEGCGFNTNKANAVASMIRDADKVGKTADGARLLARIFDSKAYHDQNAADRWKAVAYRLNPDNWDGFYEWVRVLLRDENFPEAYEVTRTAIEANRMPELRTFSVKDTRKKLWTYRIFVLASSQMQQTQAGLLQQVIGEGYNLSKVLLEKEPSARSLENAAFFSGHFRMLGKDGDKQSVSYLHAIFAIGEELRGKGLVTAGDLSDLALSVSWHCLLSKDFSGAVEVGRKGLTFSPDNIAIDTNIAHGLLLGGSKDEARAIYVRNVGKVLGDRKWESVILDDFEKMTAAGVSSPDFRQVRQWMLKGA